MKTKNDFKPLERIGLCFSGGGYRATFYGLGVLSILNKIEFKDKSLLERVKSVSSVSGGTLLAAAYCRAVQKDDYSFERYFKQMYDAFKPENDRLMDRATEKLKDDTVWKSNPHKRRSLINAFALCYQEMEIYQGTLGAFDNKELKQFETVCFNATDFTYGLTFRFQNTGFFGNSPLFTRNRNQLDYLRDYVEIGDAVASSSCFPIGFAPIIFPDDFFKDQDSTAYKSLKSMADFENGVGLMDGGIADNQGIASMVNADKRADGKLDLILVNDVGGYQMLPWQLDDTALSDGASLTQMISKFLDYFKLRWMYWLPMVVSIIMMALNNLEVFGDRAYASIYIVFATIMGMSLLATVLGGISSILKNTLVNKVTKIFETSIPAPIMDDVLRLKSLRVSLIKRMLADRLSSSYTMINYVFMNQIRRLNYDLFYKSKNLKNRRATSMIYELNGVDSPYTKKIKEEKGIKKPSELLVSTALTASQMPTTLWWSKKDIEVDRMDKLIACGQFTVCYNVLKYIIHLKAGEEDQSNIDKLSRDTTLEKAVPNYPELDAVQHQPEELWETFNADPLWLVREMK